jgi:membrane-associated phospholipid phosphatase
MTTYLSCQRLSVTGFAAVWYPLLLLLGFGIFFHIAVAVVIGSAGLPMCYVPHGELQLVGVLALVCVILGPGGLLLLRLVGDMVVQLRGSKPPALKERIADFFIFVRDSTVLAAVYLIVLIAYVNLKPAIPLLNGISYDGPLESFERALFAGILPTEWLVARSSPTALAFWDIVYGWLSLFMFISITIALYYEGFRGGVRLTLAYSIGLFIDVFFTLWFPTSGPIFVHPQWFEGLRNLPSGELAAFLKLTVEQYRHTPGTVYACAGISAMPSYHVYGWVCAFVYWHHLPRKVFLVGLVLTVLTWVSTIVLGWHYFLDGLAGIVLALLVSWIMTRVIPRSP